MRIATRFATGVVPLTLLTGCARFNAISMEADLHSGKSLITDAKQRVVTNTVLPPSALSGTLGRIGPNRVVCAEPSPDGATAISEPFSAALSSAIQQEPVNHSART
jgi:hypothetical protein